ncbi:hypothetical protein DFH06DRAFT_1302730 [Mycena polygramma]|nr:hypothetical protein DFH06DRAFT_1302730 [Mycena polygramma]
MDIEQKGEDAQPRVTEPGAEAAAAKIWAIYIGEAEKYDKGLVESWRSDMDGMLIFAGLFSASLTAFLIESYKTLNPDSGDSTVRLLAQISQQLAASANGSSFAVPPSPKFTPSGPALVCNALWFISLGLSLSCALIATLLEQWARDFIHRSEIRSAPLIRARIFSFLYYGLKRFNMHAVVEIIPLLLHTALLFFLAGLVAFLVPVNTAMAVVAAVMLAILTAVYSLLTILPLGCLDSPYRTPLSGICWRAFQRLRLAWQRRHILADGKPRVRPAKADETMLEAVFDRAIEDCDERGARDCQALIWTVKSLSDELELEPFVEAIPRILWDLRPQKQRFGYADHFRQLALHTDVDLFARIKGLLDSCNTGLLSPEARTHRQLISMNAIWAITTLFTSPSTPAPPILHSLASRHVWDSLPAMGDEAYSSFTSATALIQWINFHTVKPRLEDIVQTSTMSLTDNTVTFDLPPVIEFLTELHRQWFYGDCHLDLLLKTYKDGLEPAVFIPKLIQTLKRTLTFKQHDIRLQYLSRASDYNSRVYAFEATLAMVQPSHPYLPQGDYENFFRTTVSIQLTECNGSKIEWMDTVVESIFCDWLTQEPPPPIAALSGLMSYLNGRQSEAAVQHVLRVDDRGWLWDFFVQAVRDVNSPAAGTVSEMLMALWRYTSLRSLIREGEARSRGWQGPSAESYQACVKELTRLNSLSLTPSILVLLRYWYLQSSASYTDPISPTAPEIPMESESDVGGLFSRHSIPLEVEGEKILCLAHFLESCAGSDPFPYKADETIQRLFLLPMTGPVREHHQIRLANAIRELFANPRCADLRTVLLNKRVFDLYAGAFRLNFRHHDEVAWLDNKSARGIIKHVFTTYAEELSSAADPPADLKRVQAMIAELDRLHPDLVLQRTRHNMNPTCRVDFEEEVEWRGRRWCMWKRREKPL